MDRGRGGARLTQAAVLFGPLANAGALGRGDRADAGATRFAPGENGGRMALVAVPGAMAGRMAATRPERVDGAFQQLADRKDLAASREGTACSWLLEPIDLIANLSLHCSGLSTLVCYAQV